MIIGISGFQSSGKDTIADYLVKEHGFVKLSFASALKDIVAIIFGWSRERLEGLKVEDRQWREEIDSKWAKLLNIPCLTPRYVLQYLGTEVFRNHFHKDIWTKIVENQLSFYENVVVSDCRFANEIEMIKQNGGKIIQVHRDDHVLKHPSELPLEVSENNQRLFQVYPPKVDIGAKHLSELPTEVSGAKHLSELEWIQCHYDRVIKNNGTIEDLHTKVNLILSDFD